MDDDAMVMHGGDCGVTRSIVDDLVRSTMVTNNLLSIEKS
jgi:hypothetical protein